jgi:hypothetical protein
MHINNTMLTHTKTHVHNNDIQNIYATHSIKDKINDLLKIISIEKIFVLKNYLHLKAILNFEKNKFIYIEFFFTC